MSCIQCGEVTRADDSGVHYALCSSCWYVAITTPCSNCGQYNQWVHKYSGDYNGLCMGCKKGGKPDGV